MPLIGQLPIRPSLIVVVVVIMTFVLPAEFSYAQLGGLGGGGSSGDNRIEGKAKFIPLPYINYDRSIGFSIGALPMVQFNPVEKDTLSPSSIGGLLGMYTTNDSWFVAGFAGLFLDRDNWRIFTGGGVGSVNFQFYLNNPIPVRVPYNTQADFFFLEVRRRVVKKVYLGVNYIYTAFQTSTEVFTDSLDTRLNGMSVNVSIDERPNLYYPRSGFYTEIEYTTYPKAFGNEFISNQITIDHNHYFPFRNEKDVLAARFHSGLGIGELSFNQQFIVGQTDIRGYTQGQFRGNYLVTLQGEYRWNFHKRFGAVGFFGLATVFEAINSSDNGKILPGGGAGLRYVVSKDTHMNAGVDIAAGKGDWGIYFRVGEAF